MVTGFCYGFVGVYNLVVLAFFWMLGWFGWLVTDGGWYLLGFVLCV